MYNKETVCTKFDQKYPKVTYYDEDYSIVVWEDHRNTVSGDQSDIYYQFLDIDGNNFLTDKSSRRLSL